MTAGLGALPDARMHLSLDTMSMVDDSCLSPSNFHEMGKGGGITAGGRVHSIDVILGFSKDQDPMLSPAVAPGPPKVDIDGLTEPGKQQEPPSHPSYSGHLSSMRNSNADQRDHYHGESSWPPPWQSKRSSYSNMTFKNTCFTPHTLFMLLCLRFFRISVIGGWRLEIRYWSYISTSYLESLHW